MSARDERFFRLEFVLVGAAWLALCPFHDLISLWLSYPMRRLAAELVAPVLGMLGYQVRTEFTSVYLGGDTSIVIADACSGVEGTIALMFVGWIVARLMQRKLGLAAVQYLFAVPSVILANAVRLIITVVAYSHYGAVVLGDVCHRSLGYFQLMLAFVFFYLAGRVVKCAS